jgi:serine protease Do
MKQNMYKIAGIAALCLAFTFRGIAQEAESTAPVPPAPPVPPMESLTDSGGNQSELVIRQKGDKDSKVTIEIRNGDFYVNGRPLEKFDDQNIEIEKRKMDDDEPMLSVAPSPFREYNWNQDRFQREMERNLSMQAQRNMQDAQRKSTDAYRYKSNAAFLGVSSRKAETGGATILEITKSSPAEKAGLKKGDVIIKVNEEKIESPDNLFETVHQLKPWDKVKITFKRDGKEQTVSAILDKSAMMDRSKMDPEVFNYKYEYNMRDMPNLPGMESPLWGPMPPKIGIKAQDSEEGKGVNVLEVTEGSAADKAGLKKGDVITSFDGNEVNSANELIEQVRGSMEKSNVKVKILRDGKQQDLDIKIPRKLKTAEL